MSFIIRVNLMPPKLSLWRRSLLVCIIHSDNYKFPKRIFRRVERPWQSSWFKAYGWLYRETGKDAMIFYICVNQDLNGYLRSEGVGGGAAAGPGRGIWGGVGESGDWKLDGARGLWYLRLLTVWLLLLLLR